ncbi:hypothetical protein MTR_7g010555 [Medicago truncatula]|uniref:Uncharacterized protein n=1 Tax=Medicago truncatula TaxID=3880 RepID=A0A072TXL9_MEDTR|nr:hypothetical protein MTR_7g010555 [Medicago truncatula]
MAPLSLAVREFPKPRLKEKAPKNLALQSPTTPPQEEGPGLPLEAPSILHFIKLRIGGCQRTSLILGAFPNLKLDEKSLRRTKSWMEDHEASLAHFPDIEVTEMMRLIAVL